MQGWGIYSLSRQSVPEFYHLIVKNFYFRVNLNQLFFPLKPLSLFQPAPFKACVFLGSGMGLQSSRLAALPWTSSSSWGCGRPHHSQLSSMRLRERIHARGVGAMGNSCLLTVITFWGSQKNLPCSQTGCRAGERRRVNQSLPGPGSSPVPVCAPPYPWPAVHQQGKWPGPSRRNKIQHLELAVWALKNDLPCTKNSPHLTSHHYDYLSDGIGEEQSPTVPSTEMILSPKSLQLSITPKKISLLTDQRQSVRAIAPIRSFLSRKVLQGPL